MKEFISFNEALELTLSHISVGETEFLPLEQLVGMLRSGNLSDHALVWREGMENWQPAGQVVEVQQALAQARAIPGAATVGPPMSVVPQQNAMALTSMILGIISIVLSTGPFTAIPGVICGHIARRQIRESPYPQVGDGMAIAGLILGYLCIILTVVLILVLVGIFVFAATS